MVVFAHQARNPVGLSRKEMLERSIHSFMISPLLMAGVYQTPRVQVPNYQVTTHNHNHDSYFGRLRERDPEPLQSRLESAWRGFRTSMGPFGGSCCVRSEI